MAQQTINVGTSPNIPEADSIRDGGIKINANFTELYSFANNIPLSFAFTWLSEGDILLALTSQNLANYLNAKPYSFPVSAVNSPVHFRIAKGELTYMYQFRNGKGVWGSASGSNPDYPFTASSLQLISILGTQVNDVDPDNPATPIIDLDPVTDGNYLAKANAGSYDLTDAGSIVTVDGQDYEKNYYFSYTDDGILYLVQFVGAPDEYGVGGTPFTSDDFVATTNSDVEPVAAPDLNAVLLQGFVSGQPILQQVGTESYRRTYQGEEYRRDDRGVRVIYANPTNGVGTTVIYTIPAKGVNDTFAMQSDIAKNRTVKIIASGANLQDDALMGATAVTAVMSQAYGVLTEGLTFNATTGTISGVDFTGTGTNIVFYDKP